MTSGVVLWISLIPMGKQWRGHSFTTSSRIADSASETMESSNVVYSEAESWREGKETERRKVETNMAKVISCRRISQGWHWEYLSLWNGTNTSCGHNCCWEPYPSDEESEFVRQRKPRLGFHHLYLVCYKNMISVSGNHFCILSHFSSSMEI